MNICIFCSAYNSSEEYTGAARELATRIAEGGHTLVWGGSDKGTMKVIADAAQEAGGKIVGISVENFRHSARKNADEMIVAKDLSERKAILLARSDAVVVLPGGLGTLDEVSEVVELKKQGFHKKKVVILNVANFYEGLKIQMARMDKEGFIPHALAELVHFATTPKEVMDYLA